MDMKMMLALCFFAAVSAVDAEAGWKMFDRRVGMFVHWGIYSVNGWHEQEEMRGRMPRSR